MEGKLWRFTLLASALTLSSIVTSGSALAQNIPPPTMTQTAPNYGGNPNTPAPQSKDTIAARQKIFGFDNVDPKTGAVRSDRVIMSWMGVSTFAAAMNGHVMMLDGFLAYGRNGTWGNNADYVGTTVKEYAAINPEVYIFGHGHGDHMGNTPEILSYLPNLPMYGVEEHCNDIKARMAPQTVNCTTLMPAGAQFGTQAVIPASLKNQITGVEFRAVKHPHSAGPLDAKADPPFSTEQAVVRPCLAYSSYPPTGTEPVPFGGPTSGVLSLSWQFKIGNFTMGWADTTGDISGNRPVAGLGTGAEVVPVYASWPKTNVLFGSIAVSPRRIFNMQIAAIQPKLFIPIHHDPCAFDVKVELDNQLKTVPAALQPRIWYISDPGDYVRPIVFDPAAAGWN